MHFLPLLSKHSAPLGRELLILCARSNTPRYLPAPSSRDFRVGPAGRSRRVYDICHVLEGLRRIEHRTGTRSSRAGAQDLLSTIPAVDPAKADKLNSQTSANSPVFVLLLSHGGRYSSQSTAPLERNLERIACHSLQKNHKVASQESLEHRLGVEAD